MCWRLSLRLWAFGSAGWCVGAVGVCGGCGACRGWSGGTVVVGGGCRGGAVGDGGVVGEGGLLGWGQVPGTSAPMRDLRDGAATIVLRAGHDLKGHAGGVGVVVGHHRL